jgi:hypothetical protein
MDKTSNNHSTANDSKRVLVAVFNFFKKLFTHNYCDTCGFTKDNVYVTHYCTEAGIIQCNKCSDSISPKDNTINISMPKDSWSREEVIELIQKYSKECTGWPWFETDEKWIEENL